MTEFNHDDQYSLIVSFSDLYENFNKSILTVNMCADFYRTHLLKSKVFNVFYH